MLLQNMFRLLQIRTPDIAACRIVSGQRLGKHVPAATGTYALETVSSTGAVPRSYKEDNWGKQVGSVRESAKKKF
jgi:hypothetical protein